MVGYIVEMVHPFGSGPVHEEVRTGPTGLQCRTGLRALTNLRTGYLAHVLLHAFCRKCDRVHLL